MIKATQLDVSIAGPNGPNGGGLSESQVSNILSTFLVSANLGLRDVAQAVHLAGSECLILLSHPPVVRASGLVATIIYTVNRNLYYRFVHSKATDLEVSHALFDRVGNDAFKNHQDSIWFDAMIILTYAEINEITLRREDPESTPLLASYRCKASQEKPYSVDKKRAKDVSQMVYNILGQTRGNQLERIGFGPQQEWIVSGDEFIGIGSKLAVSGLEIFTPEFTAHTNT